MGNGFGMGFGGGFMWLFIVLLIIALVWIGTAVAGGSGRSRDAPRNALEILKERYANGEIDRDQFERMRRDIEA